jgi:hypothetical protein
MKHTFFIMKTENIIEIFYLLKINYIKIFITLLYFLFFYII